MPPTASAVAACAAFRASFVNWSQGPSKLICRSAVRKSRQTYNGVGVIGLPRPVVWCPVEVQTPTSPHDRERPGDNLHVAQDRVVIAVDIRRPHDVHQEARGHVHRVQEHRPHSAYTAGHAEK